MAGNTKSGRVGKNGTRERLSPTQEDKFTKKMPRTFPVKAKEYWLFIVPILKERGVIVNGDYFALCRLCILFHLYMECEETLLADGDTYESTSDRGAKRILTHPSADLIFKYQKELTGLERKFGLTPLDRMAVKSTTKNQKKSVRDKY
jgi:P27 family predicted phage terminase small subunit